MFALEYKHLCSVLCGTIYRDILKLLIQEHLRFFIPQYGVEFSIQKQCFIVFKQFPLIGLKRRAYISTFNLN